MSIPTTNLGSRIRRGSALVVLAFALFASTGAVADAQVRAEPVRDRVAEPVRDHTNDRVEELRLACKLDVVGDERGVLCRWSESSRDDVRAYQLLRIVNGHARELVATVSAGERLHAFDTNVHAGDHVVYGVIARDKAGRVVGIGGPVRLGIGR